MLRRDYLKKSFLLLYGRGELAALILEPGDNAIVELLGPALALSSLLLGSLRQAYLRVQATLLLPGFSNLADDRLSALIVVEGQQVRRAGRRLGSVAAGDLDAREPGAAPRLAISGLNPHAGEDGSLGREDIDIVAPAVEALRKDHGIYMVGTGRINIAGLPRDMDALAKAIASARKS